MNACLQYVGLFSAGLYEGLFLSYAGQIIPLNGAVGHVGAACLQFVGIFVLAYTQDFLLSYAGQNNLPRRGRLLAT